MPVTINNSVRPLIRSVAGIPASDGDGVRLTRVIGSPALNMLDPFLLLDVFETEEPQDYVGGFPTHPHRGFETVTYLLNGRMRHKDNAGHEGVIEPGGVQWMTAGSGILHSEMPEQENGLLKGFQLWVNLPAAEKWNRPAYQEYEAARIPVADLADSGWVRVIAGETDKGTTGPIVDKTTRPLFLDVRLSANQIFTQSVPAEFNGFVWVIEGQVSIAGQSLARNRIGILGEGDMARLQAGSDGARFLLVAGKPLGEPVARGGPFVMNTKEEVMEAFQDYRNGRCEVS